MITRIILCATLLVAFSSCMVRTYEHTAPLNEGELLSAESGGINVSGEVSVTTRDGDIRKGSDTTIFLLPVTDYSTEWFKHYIVRGEKIGGKDPRSFASARAMSVDRDGRFQFRHVQPGAYYLTCTVQYQRSNLRFGRMNFGMRTLERTEAYAELKVDSDQNTEIVVTRPPT